MELGLFGKLPAKRDYISHGVGRAFLETWEPWMQASIAASRDSMGDAWLPAYMNAPIWRFWLGRRVAGAPVAGAVMPSVDGVGRYFPLSLIASDCDMAPPLVNAQEAWFDAAENLLLDALEDGRSFEATLASLAELPAPDAAEPQGVEAAFAAIRSAAEQDVDETLTYWWVRPVPGTPVRAMIRRGLPGPYDYLEMIRPVAPPTEPEPEALVLTNPVDAAPPAGEVAEGTTEDAEASAAVVDSDAPEAVPARHTGDAEETTGDRSDDTLTLDGSMAVRADV